MKNNLFLLVIVCSFGSGTTLALPIKKSSLVSGGLAVAAAGLVASNFVTKKQRVKTKQLFAKQKFAAGLKRWFTTPQGLTLMASLIAAVSAAGVAWHPSQKSNEDPVVTSMTDQISALTPGIGEYGLFDIIQGGEEFLGYQSPHGISEAVLERLQKLGSALHQMPLNSFCSICGPIFNNIQIETAEGPSYFGYIQRNVLLAIAAEAAIRSADENQAEQIRQAFRSETTIFG